jgi:lauroyl/myristoyl acyltransferase
MNRQLVLSLVWLTRPAVAGLLLGCRLVPEKLALTLARTLGWLTRIGKKPEVLARVRAVLGAEVIAGERETKFWRAHLTHLGRTIIETVYLYQMSDAKQRARISVTGEEHLARVLARGRGAILFINHLGNPGAIVAGLGVRGYDITIAGNAMVATIAGEEVSLDYVESVVQRMFARCRVKRALLGDRLPRRVAETLARNGLFAMFIDFSVGRKHNQLIDFGDAHMNTNLGPALLALRHRAAVLGVTTLRVGDNRHRLTICPLMEPAEETGKAEARDLLREALGQLLPDLRAHPEQWWPWDWAEISAREPATTSRLGEGQPEPELARRAALPATAEAQAFRAGAQDLSA